MLIYIKLNDGHINFSCQFEIKTIIIIIIKIGRGPYWLSGYILFLIWQTFYFKQQGKYKETRIIFMLYIKINFILGNEMRGTVVRWFLGKIKISKE